SRRTWARPPDEKRIARRGRRSRRVSCRRALGTYKGLCYAWPQSPCAVGRHLGRSASLELTRNRHAARSRRRLWAVSDGVRFLPRCNNFVCVYAPRGVFPSGLAGDVLRACPGLPGAVLPTALLPGAPHSALCAPGRTVRHARGTRLPVRRTPGAADDLRP